MDATSHSAHRSFAASLPAMLAGGALLAPIAAFADEIQLLPEPAAFPELVIIDDGCEDLLATASPDGIAGDALAVVITAQAIDEDRTGWSNVAWQPAEDTTLRTVLITGTDGTVTEAGDATSATDAATLTFCGAADRESADRTSTPTEPATAMQPASQAETERVETAPSVPTPPPPASSTSAPPTSTSAVLGLSADTSGTSSTGEPGEPEGPDEADVLGVVVVDSPAPSAEEGPEARLEEDNEEEPQMIGIQLTRDDKADDSGPIGTGVALSAAGGILWSRRS